MEKVIARRIENGVTILTTGRSGNKVTNQFGTPGVNYMKREKKYRVDIGIKKRKYFVGFFDSYDFALKVRKLAEIKRDEERLQEWLDSRPYGGTKGYIEFWEHQFVKYGL